MLFSFMGEGYGRMLLAYFDDIKPRIRGLRLDRCRSYDESTRIAFTMHLVKEVDPNRDTWWWLDRYYTFFRRWKVCLTGQDYVLKLV
jgi:hypothetical protein